MSLKFKKAELTNDGEKNISQVENLKNESNLFLERVDSRGGLARPWTINVKTLTGRVFNVEVSSPQVGNLFHECGCRHHEYFISNVQLN